MRKKSFFIKLKFFSFYIKFEGKFEPKNFPPLGFYALENFFGGLMKYAMTIESYFEL